MTELTDVTTTELLAPRDFSSRAFVLEDMTVRADGDGRTVEAYAAVFNTPAEINDADGHYSEVLDPGSFNKTIADKGNRFGVFYNHAMTIYGTPDGSLSVPIGAPQRVEADERGVFTVTRYLDNPLADAVLDGIKNRAIRGQSFTGRFIKSQRTRAKSRGELPTIRRLEVAMREYGPTVFPTYTEAAILGTRSVAAFLAEIESLTDEDRDRFRQMLGLATPLEPAGSPDTATAAVPPDEPVNTGHSARHSRNHLGARARREGGPLS